MSLRKRPSGHPKWRSCRYRPLMTRLAGSGLALGIATNDHESTARAHLEQADVLDLFEFVAGFRQRFRRESPTSGCCWHSVN